MDPAVTAAAGALLIALLNEARAMSRARAARVEREEYREDLRKDVLQAERRQTPDEGAGSADPASSPDV